MSLFHIPSGVPLISGKTLAPIWEQLLTNIADLLNSGYPPPQNSARGIQVAQSITIPTAALTPTGTAGSLTFTNGILTAVKDPT